MAFKFNPLTGELDLVGSKASVEPDNFSFKLIPSGTLISVPAGQQMLFEGDIDVEGELAVDGEISELVNYSEWAFGWNFVPFDVSLQIATMRDLLFIDGLTIDGSVTVEGRMVEVA